MLLDAATISAPLLTIVQAARDATSGRSKPTASSPTVSIPEFQPNESFAAAHA
jgi:hypothetical protein